MLGSVANLTALATSRAPLRLTAEHTYGVQPLANSNAAALFKARAAASRADWAPADEDGVVAQICARLEGLPLAVELAADRARWLPLPALLERLERRLGRTSLVVVEAGEDAQPRLTMLETVREFAAEHVPRAELLLLRLRHAHYFVSYAEQAAEAASHGDRRRWLARLARQRGNLRVALERMLKMGAASDALRIAIAFARALL